MRNDGWATGADQDMDEGGAASAGTEGAGSPGTVSEGSGSAGTGGGGRGAGDAGTPSPAAEYVSAIDPDATGVDALADAAEIYDPMRSGLDDVGTTRNDAACVVPWVTDGYQALEIYVDPLVDDRIASICELATAWSATYRDLDSLADAINDYADGEGLSASIFPRPEGELSEGVVAVSITAG